MKRIDAIARTLDTSPRIPPSPEDVRWLIHIVDKATAFMQTVECGPQMSELRDEWLREIGQRGRGKL